MGFELEIKSKIHQLKTAGETWPLNAEQRQQFEQKLAGVDSQLEKIYLLQQLPEHAQTIFWQLESWGNALENHLQNTNTLIQVNNTPIGAMMFNFSALERLLICTLDQLNSLHTESINCASQLQFVSEDRLNVSFSCQQQIRNGEIQGFNHQQIYPLLPALQAHIHFTTSVRLGTQVEFSFPYAPYYTPPHKMNFLKKELLLLGHNRELSQALAILLAKRNDYQFHLAENFSRLDQHLFQSALVTDFRHTTLIIDETALKELNAHEQKILEDLLRLCASVVVLASVEALKDLPVLARFFHLCLISDVDINAQIDAIKIHLNQLNQYSVLSHNTDTNIRSLDFKYNKDNLELGMDFQDIQQTPKILLVDDSGLTRQVIRDSLEQNHFLVDEAENGKIALEMVKKETYHLILVDLVMPEMSGIEFTQIVKNIESYQKVPVVGITGDANVKKENEFLFSGGDSFLLKSINPVILAERITHLLMKTMLHDNKIAETYSQGDDKRQQKLMMLYLKEVQASIKSLSTSGDWHEVRDVAHKLVSSSLYCGYVLTRQKAMDLEDSVNAGEGAEDMQKKRKLLLDTLSLTEEHLMENFL